MGDSRAEIKITFSIYGKTFRGDMSINYHPDDFCGIDPRVAEWFANRYAKARSGYDTLVAMRQAEENERNEREQLARLKAKYDFFEAQERRDER